MRRYLQKRSPWRRRPRATKPRVKAFRICRNGSFLCALGVCLVAGVQPSHALAADAVVVDRVAVRFVSPETGGSARPRFLTSRELGFYARCEASLEGVSGEGDGIYPERYVRAATDRLVARQMLAQLLIQRGSEPPDLPSLVLEARAELADRLGGASVLEESLQREGLEDQELLALLRDQVRAAWYLDKAVSPILAVSEDSLREAFRVMAHPFRSLKFEDARLRVRRWLATERMRAAELEFLQAARTRIKVVAVTTPPPMSLQPSPLPVAR